MPELPEVETVRRILSSKYVNRKINKIDIIYPKMIHSPLDEFVNTFTNQTITSVTRRGKYLFINFDNEYSIISHLRMEGKYILREMDEEISKYTRVIFYLDDNTKLCYEDSRCFGVMFLSKTSEIFNNKEVSKLGPEPFDIKDAKYLYDIYQKTNLEIKLCLLDQSIMCGLGNIYCDEVLFMCKLNPYQKAKSLTLEDCENVLKYSIITLNKAIALGGSTVSSYHPEKGIDGRFQNELNVYGKEGCHCINCGTILRKDKLGGRGTTYCPKCQKVALSIGLTGKIAAGKSTVLKYFKERGIPTFSCDYEINELYKENDFKALMVEKFSSQVLNDDLTISKGYIKNVITEDPKKKKELEGIIHPLVKQKIRTFIQKNKEAPLVICEVPLLFETHFDRLFDYNIGVSCSSITQINNLKNRGSKTVSLDLQLNNSSTFDKNAYKCDYLINNDGTLEELHKELDRIYDELTKHTKE